MTTFRMFGSLVLVSALAAPAADASPIPGATYTGTAATGGTVSLDVSALGGAVTRFAWSEVPRPTNPECGTLSGNFIGSAPILAHGFSGLTYMRFSGSFPGNQQAAGRLRWHVGPGGPTGSCGGISIGWTATTTAVAPPPPTSDEIPPVIDVSVRERMSRSGKLTLWVATPEEACRVTVAGKVSIAGGAQTFRLRRVRSRLPHGANLPRADFPIEPRLRGRAHASVQRALRAGRRVEAHITVRAVDAAGNVRLERSTIRLSR